MVFSFWEGKSKLLPFDKLFCLQEIFDVLFILRIGGSDLFQPDEVVNRWNPERDAFSSGLEEGRSFETLLKLNRFTFNISYAPVKEKVISSHA